MNDNTTEERLWRFSLAAYQSDGVKTGVLMLQDRYSADVNLLFLCCFIANSGRGRLTDADIRRAEKALLPWTMTVTRKLRNIRNEMQTRTDCWSLPGAAAVRAKVLEAELESEKTAQSVLQQLFNDKQATAPVKPLNDAVSNLGTYLDSISCRVSGDVKRVIADLLRATLDAQPSAIEAAMRSDLACDER